ncbi:MAG: SDR family NAD(P)-dependent oxidoreductase [Armatimonadetes bacterium]|nr:SDR family NAD(P)-dependent oxidoreductase [Armatimonadota bacterium]
MYRTVITGASSGIGRATAILLAKEGHSLILNARREKQLNELAELCLAEGAPAASAAAGDITDQKTAQRIAASASQLEGELVLVNNAGFVEFGDFHESDIERAAGMVDVMLTGTMRTTHALLPLMLADGKGTVVNVLSVAAKTEFPGAAAYCAAKAGAHMFSRVLCQGYRQKGVRVTSIIPGSTDTPIWDPIESHPPREDMMPASAVAEAIRDAINAPRDRAVEEIVLTPPKGIL